MGLPGAALLMSLLLVVAVVAALCGFLAATAVHQRNRRTRRVFLVGIFCGLLAGQIVRGRRHGFKGLSARKALKALKDVVLKDVILRDVVFSNHRVRDHRVQNPRRFHSRALKSAARLLT